MTQPVLVKVYGNISPFSPALEKGLATLMAEAMPEPGKIASEGNLLLVSFEGIYFPIAEAIDLIDTNLSSHMTGKLDYLDLEAWRLTRYTIANGEITPASAPLNNVLDYSGH